MIFTVEIDDKSETGKSILHLLKDLSKKTSAGIHFIETVEDNELLKKMKRSLKSGKSGEQEVNKTLKATFEEAGNKEDYNRDQFALNRHAIETWGGDDKDYEPFLKMKRYE